MALHLNRKKVFTPCPETYLDQVPITRYHVSQLHLQPVDFQDQINGDGERSL